MTLQFASALAVCALSVSGLLGCVSSAPLPGSRAERSQPPPPAVEAGDTGVRSMIFLLEDRRLYEPVTVNQALGKGPAVRSRLAWALGRVGGADAELVLEELLIDSEIEVRRDAAFSTAVLSSLSVGAVRPTTVVPATGALVAALASEDVASARYSAQALALRGVGLDEVSDALVRLIGEDEAAAELWSRLLPALPLFDRAERQAAARVYLESRSGETPPAGASSDTSSLHRSAIRALLLDPDEVDLALHRQLCVDPDPWIRAWGCRALGQFGERGDLERLREVASLAVEVQDLLARSAVLAATIEAAAHLVRRGVVAPSKEWRSLLLAHLSSPLAGARLAAQRAADAWLLDETLAAVLHSQVEDGEGEALLALARGGAAGAPELVATAALSQEVSLAAAAGRAAALLGLGSVLEPLLADPRPMVRWGALRGVAEAQPDRASATLEIALEDPSASVRASALRWLADRPLLGLEEIEGSFEGLPRNALELRLQSLLALESLANARRLERGATLVALEELSSSTVYPVRTGAAAALARLGRPVPEVGGPDVRRTASYYDEIDRRSRGERFLRMSTTQGDLVLRLPCSQAPQSCVSFVQLAEQGFYDGLGFSRLVPGARLSGGDPFGDGFGGPGYRLRDEPTTLDLDRAGMLVLERSGGEAGGSRFFLTLGPMPERSRQEVVLGELFEGRDALARLSARDRILELREIPPPSRGGGRDRAGKGAESPGERGSERLSP